MRGSRVYGSASDVYMQNNYLNNTQTQGGKECEYHAYRGARQTCLGKIIPNPK